MNSREVVTLERRIEKLSEERIDLFARVSANINLTVVERTRLKTIETRARRVLPRHPAAPGGA